MKDLLLRTRLEALGLIGFTVIAILPVVAGLIYALLYSLGLAGLLSHGFTTEHWAGMLESAEIWISLAVSSAIAGATVTLTTLTALFLAMVLRVPLKRGALATIIYLPLALPATVAAFFIFRIFSDAGLFPRLLVGLEWIERPGDFPALIHDPLGAGIILAHMLLAVPYFTLLFRQIYADAGIAALLNLTATLGGTPRQGFLRVTLPILVDKASTNLLLLFIPVLGSYEIPLLLGAQSPQMISVLTLRKYAMLDITQKPQAFIAALLYTFFVSILLVLAFRKGRMLRDS